MNRDMDEPDETLEGPEERRQHDRSRLIVDVFFDGNDATGVASTTDISPGGFYLKTQANLAEGAKLMVRIPFPDGRQVVADAEVIHIEPSKGVGLRFRDLSDENRALIESELGRE